MTAPSGAEWVALLLLLPWLWLWLWASAVAPPPLGRQCASSLAGYHQLDLHWTMVVFAAAAWTMVIAGTSTSVSVVGQARASSSLMLSIYSRCSSLFRERVNQVVNM